MAKRQIIGVTPLEAYISTNVVNNGVEVLEKRLPKKKETEAVKKKHPITVQISEDVIGCIKNAVSRTPGLTLAALAEEVSL